MTSLSRTKLLVCKVRGCPAPESEAWHQNWCGHGGPVTHQHWPKKGMGGNNPKSRIVAALCYECHDRIDNGDWGNGVQTRLASIPTIIPLGWTAADSVVYRAWDIHNKTLIERVISPPWWEEIPDVEQSANSDIPGMDDRAHQARQSTGHSSARWRSMGGNVAVPDLLDRVNKRGEPPIQFGPDYVEEIPDDTTLPRGGRTQDDQRAEGEDGEVLLRGLRPDDSGGEDTDPQGSLREPRGMEQELDGWTTVEGGPTQQHLRAEEKLDEDRKLVSAGSLGRNSQRLASDVGLNDPDLAPDFGPDYLTLPQEYRLEDAAQWAGFIGKYEHGRQWYAGDLVNDLEARFGHERVWGHSVMEDGRTIIDLLGMKSESVRNCQRVCAVFPRYRGRLTFGHYAVVYKLPDAKEWLDSAEHGAWTVAELRRQVGGHERPETCVCPSCGQVHKRRVP